MFALALFLTQAFTPHPLHLAPDEAVLQVPAPAIRAGHGEIELSRVGDWAIRTNRDKSQSCFGVAAFADGTLLRMDRTNANGGARLSVHTPRAREADASKPYPVALFLSDSGRWEGMAQVVALQPRSKILTINLDGEFLAQLAESPSVTLTHDGAPLTWLGMQGLGEVMSQLDSCTARVSASKPS